MHDPRLSHEPYDPDEPYLAGHADEPFEQCFAPPRDSSAASSGPVPPCPKCQSTRVDARNLARKTGGAIGAIAGTTSGIAFALSGAETGATVGLLAGPAGAVCGAIAGAVIAGLIGGAAGCATGSVFGEIVDEKVLDNFHCHACDHTFSRSKPSA
ncbi:MULTISPECIES: hypothetical protein [Paraburkholderia]|uniref:Complement resistance protein TraT n=1 Tax=Paraburkholderia madseniana TaxID=2599607 RepID=A0AAP5BC04_9BURK|nr:MULTISPECIES: hypothetical protein [Paraburkholderia]MCX4146912.1 hypothetical protein [Paraburkholderia madseniana]MDN7149858.1 complement resistance protein TraT [Paraburkholderia sp. WS6]MDQ6408738.1 complement resistance protein TraT [Paraburkholderia madseniana]